MCHKQIFVLLLCGLFFLSKGNCQTEDSHLIAARPGLSPFPSKLDKGVLVFEAGYSHNNAFTDGGTNLKKQFPIQLRYGLLENMEINIAFTYQSISLNDTYVDSLFRGLDATTVGMKFKIAEERGIYPQIEFQAKLKLPYFGEEAFIPEDVEPAFNLTFLHNINDAFQFTYGFGMFWRGPDENGFYGLKATRFLNNSSGLFIEHYSYLRGNERNETHLGAGYILLINKKLQLDVGLDVGGMKDRTFFGGTLGLAVLLKE